MVAITKEWKAANQAIVDKLGWIVAFGYDDAQLKEKRHPIARELDEISQELPVVLIHQSGHLAAMNTKGLELAGYTADSKDPKGGAIRRIAGSNQPNGVLEEMAFFIPLFSIFNKIDAKGSEAIVKAGSESYAKFGFTTAQEGRATRAACETFQRIADSGKLMLDVYAISGYTDGA